MRLINADALKDVVKRINDVCGGITERDFKIIECVIFFFPSNDAVPVVRCKECKHRPIVGGDKYRPVLKFPDNADRSVE